MLGGGAPSVPSLSIGNPLNADSKDGEAKETKPEDLEADKGDNPKDDKEAHDKEIADETTNLLNTFARQPEEWENHRSFCAAIIFFVFVNLILFMILKFA